MRGTVVVLLTAALAWAGGPASGEDLTPKDVAAGRKLYVAKCAKCHRFYQPKSYSEVDWGRWMELMSQKAKLKPEQDKLLRQYLDEYRAGRISKVK